MCGEERDLRRAKRLLDRGCGYLGMIAEVRAKCSHLQDQLRDGVAPSEVAPRLAQMRQDLATYSRKLARIYRELHRHGFLQSATEGAGSGG